MKNSLPFVILGSARNDGNTKAALNFILGNSPAKIQDLNDLNISYFDYSQKNINDDFIPLIEEMLEYDSIVLASPVYWYSISAIMKTFIDRWGDLVTIRKDLGRLLKNKKIYLVTSYSSEYTASFEIPIKLSSEYMGMNYIDCYYHYCGSDSDLLKKNTLNATKFKKLLFTT